ncbi:MAG TPA: hypothetical protein VKC60_04580 [Opitutaceae bacterium]|nr:hypothetical protein [Opitutaceae bacterium]
MAEKRAIASTPYLIAVGSPPLRFAEPPIPIPAAAPPTPPDLTDVSHDTKNEDTSHDITAPRAQTAPLIVTAGPSPDQAGKRPSTETSPLILDEARPEVRPEDVLPFFQMPGARGPFTIPPPPPPPPSSATYIQK